MYRKLPGYLQQACRGLILWLGLACAFSALTGCYASGSYGVRRDRYGRRYYAAPPAPAPRYYPRRDAHYYRAPPAPPPRHDHHYRAPAARHDHHDHHDHDRRRRDDRHDHHRD